MLQLLIPRKKHPSVEAGGEVEKLYNAVVVRFKEIGRVSVAGKHMLDSSSKEDLLKVLRSLAPGTLLLFGVKALLRKRGDIKNVEIEAGAGNPKA